jgi:light-regulated signal transduction histidine kinase (bacteriophytochrome)
MNSATEVAALIATLHTAGQRLEELTAGQVDSVMDREGRSFLLRHAQVELRESEAAKQAVILELKSVNEELARFSDSVSHDLRTPLGQIMAFAELLQQGAGPSLPPEQRQHLTTISESARQMMALIDDLLAFSRAGHAELLRTSVDIEQLVRDVVGDFQAHTGGRHIVWNIHPLPPVWVDRALLRMALVNLISNAVKFTAARTEPRIEIGCVPGESDETVFFIRDNGAGFDARYADKLFGVFQRLHSQAQFEGTGIGLANVQRIVQRHGGRVWAKGAVDAGATFNFSIPLIKGQPLSRPTLVTKPGN